MLIAAVIGKDGRTTALTRALEQSPLIRKPVEVLSDGKGACLEEILAASRDLRPDFVVVGPEEPLEKDVVERLRLEGIACVGPSASLARVESSKVFTRRLLAKHGIPGNPTFRVFENSEGIADYIEQLDGFVVKPDGLSGGKGVKVSDVHLYSVEDAVSYAEELLGEGHQAVLIEEKLEGEEFSLQSFCDGTTLVDMPVVQDHKRVGRGDTGPNTGGMGSYSCENHSLPFLTEDDVRQASEINQRVANALFLETGERYKGILYGGFIVTRNGIRLIEYNARFGDPEALNVLSLLETDFARICIAIVAGNLSKRDVAFRSLATVCKYVVPDRYPDNPVKNQLIDLSDVPPPSDTLKWFPAALEERNGGLYLTGSRAIAFVGIGKNLEEAELIAEHAASAVKGPVYHRDDIGTRQLISQRVDHVRRLVVGG